MCGSSIEHKSLLFGGQSGELDKMASGAVTTNTSPLKMSLEEQLVEHGRIGYDYEISKDKIHTLIRTRYPYKVLFNFGRIIQLSTSNLIKKNEPKKE